MQINLVKEGLLDSSKLSAWSKQKQNDIYAGVKRGMDTGGARITEKVRAKVRSSLRVKSVGFIKSFKHKVFAKSLDKFPVMTIGSKVYFTGIFERGGVIQGSKYLWIPLPGFPRLSRKKIASLASSKTTFIKPNAGGYTVFQKVIGGGGGRAIVGGTKTFKGGRFKSGSAIPIAVLVPRATIKKRLGLESTVRANIGALVSAIEQELRIT